MTDHTPHDRATAPGTPGTARDVDEIFAPDAPAYDASASADTAFSDSAFTADASSENVSLDHASPDAADHARDGAANPSSDGDDPHGDAGRASTGDRVDEGAPRHASAVGGTAHPGDAPQFGVGPFSVREVALLGTWILAFFVSFFRTNILDSPSGVLVGGVNVWSSGLWWIPAMALPTAAVGLIALRRLSPQGIRRVGSLGIDQFASVAFSISALVWVAWVWDTVAVFGDTGIWTRSWVVWVEAVLLLAGVVLTVAGPWIPPFSRDFRGRDEVAAHRNARPIRPVVPRPRTPRPVHVAAGAPVTDDHDGSRPDSVSAHDEAPVPGSYTGSTDLTHEGAPATSVLPTHADDHNDTDVFAPLRGDDHDGRGVRDEDPRHDHASDAPSHDAQDDHRHAPHHAQAFWALAPVEREVVDDYGTPIFRVGPTAWALVVEDRGETFVIRHDDGRIGYLHDVSGVTRG
ncbi:MULTISPECIES: hypothetical protein [unclassified Microbacterium]|uniref:hypothetical protein n=1 Tax=unclassified Microbacterium TaxID=2609290 RepID=UPI001FCEC699|nr:MULTISPECIES: hypothetical protein [unclassified Microbacterium]